VDIERVDSQSLSESDLSQVRALCDLAYGEPVFETFGGGVHLLGRHHGQLICHAMWVTRWLQPGTRPPLETAYVELVATHPDHRKRGHATDLMERLAEEIADYELGGLSPATLGLYERLGWQHWHGPLFARTDRGTILTPDEHVMVLPLLRTPPLDFGAPLSVEWRPGEVW
jgi:aminoglycoside 2'-N-acetyltransferase I